MTIEAPRLTKLATCAGCAAKVGATELMEVVRYLADRQPNHNPDLLVGLAAPDDAAVYRLNPEQAVVITTDFFAPLVDDPYSYGAVAAANALSDIYAMGGEAVLALNIAAFPVGMGPALITEILSGGADKVQEAGAVIAGGHTIIDAEPKYGLCVLGLVHPDRIFTKAGARPGDLLFYCPRATEGRLGKGLDAWPTELAIMYEDESTYVAFITREQWPELFFPADGEDLRKTIMEAASDQVALIELIESSGCTMPREVTQ